MTVFFHELKQNKVSLIIWTSAIAFMMAICVLIYPEMGSQMDEISKSFAEMGGFSQAFGMDKLNFGEFIGFFGIECGNVLGLGGAFFSAIIGITALEKEEKDHTAEFLLTTPISRTRILTEKLLSIFSQLLIMNVVIIVISTLSMLAVNVSANAKTLTLLYLAYFTMHLEIACITFGISAFIRRGGVGIGLGIATVFYFINIIANLIEQTKILKFFTPFGYTEGAEIITNKSINLGYIIVGIIVSIISVFCAFYKYNKKDIQ